MAAKTSEKKSLAQDRSAASLHVKRNLDVWLKRYRNQFEGKAKCPRSPDSRRRKKEQRRKEKQYAFRSSPECSAEEKRGRHKVVIQTRCKTRRIATP